MGGGRGKDGGCSFEVCVVGGGNLRVGDKGAGEKQGWETVHPRAPAAPILPPQPSCPNTPGPAPLSPCSGCLGPSFPASFFFLLPPPPLLPWAGGTRGQGATKRVRMGEGSPCGALTTLQPQPPHPHDLHRKGAPGWGRRGTSCAPGLLSSPGLIVTGLLCPLTSDLCPG